MVVAHLHEISIITRAKRTSELKPLIKYLSTYNCNYSELIAVCKEKDWDPSIKIKLIIENSNRFKARITGINAATGNYALLLDSDQMPKRGLIEELQTRHEDMVIIPERSTTSGLASILLNDWRYRNERLAQKFPSPNVPVIPRYYKLSLLRSAISNMPDFATRIINHEDSILYVEAYKLSKSIGFAKNYILNIDPSILVILKKAFNYGIEDESSFAYLSQIIELREYLQL